MYKDFDNISLDNIKEKVRDNTKKILIEIINEVRDCINLKASAFRAYKSRRITEEKLHSIISELDKKVYYLNDLLDEYKKINDKFLKEVK